MENNLLINSENLIALKKLIYDYRLKGKIDLVYIDPPFATNNVFRYDEERANTISANLDAKIAHTDKLQGKDYLSFLKERIVLIKELMSPYASIYLHIDYKIGHYVKVLMDEIFGIQNFRADIARIKCNPKNFKRKNYGNVKDMILFYTKTSNYIWNEVSSPYTKEDIEKLFKKVESNGRRYTTVPLHAPGETKNGQTSLMWKGILPPKGRHWRCAPSELDLLDKRGLIEWSSNKIPRKKIYADEFILKGKKMQDIWEFKDPQSPAYPTEKNSNMLEFIIKNSSNENSIVLDCCCGSGTTILAAQKLNRKWIAVDESEKAILVTKKKLSTLDSRLFEKKSKVLDLN
ncbi:MAG: site-specific DNA-methyltransferase [Ignavibacteria bacterium]|nr:site-specific DNA-methyltransferase [Ignavibacteria bacterium]